MADRVLRGVVVSRPSEYELLLATHGTRGQAEFFLSMRGQKLDQIEDDHRRTRAALSSVLGALPARWRRANVSRAELNRFLFEPDDVVIAVGQDGLVANVAKYLTGQFVIGINPLPDKIDGVLARHPVQATPDLLADLDRKRSARTEDRTMVQATLDDGQTLVALNEIFLGHRSHQSARYFLEVASRSEHHSSSGLVCCSGTGATGWARSINGAIARPLPLPAPTDQRLAFFVREAWPSRTTGTAITSGEITPDHRLIVRSEMSSGGVAFGDGIEDDYLTFDWGRMIQVGIAEHRLKLIV